MIWGPARRSDAECPMRLGFSVMHFYKIRNLKIQIVCYAIDNAKIIEEKRFADKEPKFGWFLKKDENFIMKQEFSIIPASRRTASIRARPRRSTACSST